MDNIESSNQPSTPEIHRQAVFDKIVLMEIELRELQTLMPESHERTQLGQGRIQIKIQRLNQKIQNARKFVSDRDEAKDW